MIQWKKMDVEYFLGIKDALETILEFQEFGQEFGKELTKQKIKTILSDINREIENLGDKMEKNYEFDR